VVAVADWARQTLLVLVAVLVDIEHLLEPQVAAALQNHSFRSLLEQPTQSQLDPEALDQQAPLRPVLTERLLHFQRLQLLAAAAGDHQTPR
jgi:hypothetical protein